MNIIKFTLTSILLVAIFSSANAQFFEKLTHGDWIVGAGWNIVDDNGKKTENFFGQSDAWNLQMYPSSVRVEKHLDKGFSFLFTGAYNNYKETKDINGLYNESSTFFSLDLGAKYNFVSLFYQNEKRFGYDYNYLDFLDVYAALGAGYTYRSTTQVNSAATINLGVGVNFSVYQNWGINLDATAKFGVNNFWKTAANYTQYSFGVIYYIRKIHLIKGVNKHKITL